jgi:hypothetical protein
LDRPVLLALPVHRVVLQDRPVLLAQLDLQVHLDQQELTVYKGLLALLARRVFRAFLGPWDLPARQDRRVRLDLRDHKVYREFKDR